MKFKFEYQKYHPWFGFWSAKKTPALRDLGDYVLWIGKVQVTIWIKK